MKALPVGKLPIEVLRRTALRMTGARSERLRLAPAEGVDFAAVDVGGGMHMIVSSDPITGVSEEIGWYAVNVSANDVATSGARPELMESVILLPEGSDELSVRRITAQIDRAARKLGIAIAGGHTEVTHGLHSPIVVATVFAFAMRYVTSRDARPGDTMMMTKTAGLEGTAVLASRARGLDEGLRRRGAALRSRLSVVDEAVAAFESGAVHAMHDCTEGGVLGAAFEMSLASGLGFELEEASVPVDMTTEEVCSRLGADPLRLIGSGSLLLSVERGKEGVVKERLRGVSSVKEIGRFTERGRFILKSDGRREAVRSAPLDELWRLISR